MNKKTKISKEKIISLINEEAEVIKKKKELYNEVIKINSELKVLYEEQGLAGTFGFQSDMNGQGKNNSVTGFENPQNISYIAQLEKEMGEEEPVEETGLENEESDDLMALKRENEDLKEKLASFEELLNSLKNSLNENKKTTKK